MTFILRLLAPLAVFIGTTQALAYFTIAESTEIQPLGQYKLVLEPQFSLDPSGINLIAHFDKPVSRDSQLRFDGGVGAIDFFAGFHFKWVPIPDYDKQPGIGLRLSAIFAHEQDINILTTRVAPMVSKIYDIDRARLIPYASLPIGVSIYKSSSSQPINLALGAEIIPKELDQTQFGIETGFNVKESFSYLSVYLSFLFDDQKGPSFR